MKEKINLLHPGLEVLINPRSSRGDRELSVPLSSLEGVDFFTQEIFEALENGEGDLAVHSLKDMSAPHFFSHDAFAIPDRDDVRDIAIFNANVVEKIRAGEILHIGTCSPRREEMAIVFLKKALPYFGKDIQIEVHSIRGNVEGRLTQLSDGHYDGTILATAGLNRLLANEKKDPIDHTVSDLLKGKLTMLLPLMECVPAPCQGAIVVEANPINTFAVSLLQQLNNKELFQEVYAEKKKAFEFGTGCLQKFGVTTLRTAYGNYLYAAGEDQHARRFSEWDGLPNVDIDEETIFSSTDHMRSFFEYTPETLTEPIQQSNVFIANYKALLSSSKLQALEGKQIWVSGTKTWFEVAREGFWVNGSADALGFEQLLPVLSMPLLTVSSTDICIITHQQAAERWIAKGFNAVYNYQLHPAGYSTLESPMKKATLFFWSSFAQFEHFHRFVSPIAKHICASGETATLLRNAGIDPVVFPTIKSFEQWRRTTIH